MNPQPLIPVETKAKPDKSLQGTRPLPTVDSFSVIVVWDGICAPWVCRTSVQAILSFRVSTEKLGFILLDLALYVTWSLYLATLVAFLFFCTFDVLIREFLFWPCLIGVLYSSCTLIGTFSFKLGKCSPLIFVKNIFLALCSYHLRQLHHLMQC